MTGFAPALKRLRPTSGAPAALLQRKCAACGSHKPAGRNCDGCDNLDRVLQRRPPSAGSVGLSDSVQAPPIVHEVLRSSGQPLGKSERAFFEPRFGHDFSSVRVHSDAKAAASAQEVGAEAYTVGSNIVFAGGRWSGAAGNDLLAHELAHVVQQANFRGGATPQSTAQSEAEADRVAVAVASGSKPPTVTGAASGVQRKVVLRDVGKGENSGFHRRDEIIQRLNDLKCGLTFALSGDGELKATEIQGATLSEFGKQMLGFTDPAKATIPLRLTNREGRQESKPTKNPGVYDEEVFIDAWSSGYVDVDDLLSGSDLGFQIGLVHFLRERAETKNYSRRIGTASLSTEDGLPPEFWRAHKKGLASELLVLRDFFGDPKIRALDPLKRVYRTARNDTIRVKIRRGSGNAGRGIDGVHYEVVTRKDGKIHTPEEYLALLAAEAGGK
ncbi:MAG: DUF4157 domain-containing protein [Allosphingosinicella sp.]